jgi:hypothetical protein
MVISPKEQQIVIKCSVAFKRKERKEREGNAEHAKKKLFLFLIVQVLYPILFL